MNEFTMPSLDELKRTSDRLWNLNTRKAKLRAGDHPWCICRYCQVNRLAHKLSRYVEIERFVGPHPYFYIAPVGQVIPVGPYSMIRSRRTRMPWDLKTDSDFLF